MDVLSNKAILHRRLGWIGFYGLVLICWGLLYQMARGNGILCGPDTVRLLPLGGFATLFPMWAVMMAAMMLPTIIPTLRTYDRLPVAANAGRAGWSGLVLGYGAVWLIGSAGFAAIQVVALERHVVDLTGIVSSPWLASGLFLMAGFWQFSQTKQTCQDACLTPMQLFLSRWKPGFSGGLRMGVDVGVVCVGCCWAIMALAFVGGVMSLLWMGLATLFMVMEKLPEIGASLRQPAGAALIGAGVITGLSAMGIF